MPFELSSTHRITALLSPVAIPEIFLKLSNMQLLCTLLFASYASAQLYVGSQFLKHKQVDSSSSFLGSGLPQQPLLLNTKGSFIGDESSKYLDKLPFQPGSFTKTAQNGIVCATHGEAQWTGSIDVSDTRRLFYWAFESRNDPANDPVIIWMNGGPGGSSTIGLFSENGPCILPPNKTHTVPNEWSWNNNATVVYLDQPSGVGLSFRHPDSKVFEHDDDGAEDFQQFLNVLLDKILPEQKNASIIIAAESYGGHYAPTYVNHILQSRKYNGHTAFQGNISGIILVNAALDFGAMAMGKYGMLCENEDAKGILNDTACANMAASMPELERMIDLCHLHGKGTECSLLQAFADNKVNVYYQEKIESGERSSFNSRSHSHPLTHQTISTRFGSMTFAVLQSHTHTHTHTPATLYIERLVQ